MGTPANIELFQIRPRAPVSAEQKRSAKKKLARRLEHDYSQALRHGFQLAFLGLNVYLGGLFYLWVRAIEAGRPTASIERPPGVEGWLPIAGLMNLKYWLLTRTVPRVHPAAMFLLITFLSISFLFHKAFCSWLCPIGTLSEWLWQAGRKLVGRNFAMPRWLDVPLRGLKYLLLGFFLWAISTMSAEAIAEFMRSPYGLIADVKMLNFFREIGTTGAIVLAVLGIASLFVQNFWCRYLCPYGALLGFASIFSPLRIRRDAEKCIDCGKCAVACPSMLPVDRLPSIRSAECTACLNCVAVCPAQDALWIGLPERLGLSARAGGKLGRAPRWDDSRRFGRLPAWAVATGIAVVFLGLVSFAQIAGDWKSDIAARVYTELVPHADLASHPMPK